VHSGASAVTEGVSLECTVSLDENFESVDFGEFSKMGTIFLAGK
jgi:hypothetical protein